jgi:lipopolysaccharide transport system permease protein
MVPDPGSRGRRDGSLPVVPSEPARTASSEVWTIEPRRQGFRARVREVWTYRHLLKYFAARYLEKTYARTVLGKLWIPIRPLLPILVNTMVFGGLIGVSSGDTPYFLFFLVGTTSWQLFDQSMMWVTRSLELNRKLLPVASVSAALIEGLMLLGLVAVSVVWFAVRDGKCYLVLGPNLLLAAAALVLSIGLALSIGLWTSVVGAYARDVRFTLRYILGFWFYLTPVIYPVTYIPENVRWIAALNPMAAIVETFKWGTLGIGTFSPGALGLAVVVIALIFVSGVWYFGKAEASAVDRL